MENYCQIAGLSPNQRTENMCLSGFQNFMGPMIVLQLPFFFPFPFFPPSYARPLILCHFHRCIFIVQTIHFLNSHAFRSTGSILKMFYLKNHIQGHMNPIQMIASQTLSLRLKVLQMRGRVVEVGDYILHVRRMQIIWVD